MILGRCDERLSDTLYSVNQIADEVCLLQTVEHQPTADLIKGLKFNGELKHECDPTLMHEDGFLRSFGEARNQNFAMATGDMVMWIDADDMIHEPQKLREAIEYWDSEGADIIRMDYDYEFNADGQCTTRHTRERIVRNGYCEWNKNAPIHEVLSPVRQCNFYDLDREVSYIIHNNIKDDTSSDRGMRNVTMLERIVAEGGDQRMNMYFGNSLIEVGRLEEALEQFAIYLEQSTWDEEKYQVTLRMNTIYRELGMLDMAKIMSLKAVEMIPTANMAYLSLAELAALDKKWTDVIHWVTIFNDAETLSDGMIHNPMTTEVQPLILLQRAYVELGSFEKAMSCTRLLRQKMPARIKDWEAVDAFCAKELRDLDLIKSYEKIIEVTPEEERQAIYDSIPTSIAKYPPFYRNQTKDRPDGKKVVAIFCGFDDTQEWGPESIKQGIGGSEEAVINISREYADLGWTVEVYNNCTNEGKIDGVNWYQASASNPNDLVDLCILWRHPHLVKNAPRGRQTWLWNHDLCDGMEPYYSEEIMEQIDRVMFLSNSHRQTAPWVADEKVMITSNGIDPFLVVDGDNDANTVIYASSPDRGLDTLLSYWPEVVKARPDAKLKVFYGFNKWFDLRYKNDKEMMQWKQDLLDQMENDPSVTYYGSVGQDVLAEHISSSGVWAYPTHFGETNCITAMKMQAGGAIPVCSNYAALNETVKFGVKLGEYEVPEFDPEEFKAELIDMIGNEEKQKAIRSEMKDWSKKNFTWKKIASEWNTEFRSGVGRKTEKVTR